MRLIEETDSHFTMHDGRSAFRVLKKGLSEGLHQKIRAMAPKMAEGGDVGMGGAGGRGGGEEAPAETPAVAAQPTPQQIAAEVAADPTLAARIFGGASAPASYGEGGAGGGGGSSPDEALMRGGSSFQPQAPTPGVPPAAPAAGSRMGVPEMEKRKAELSAREKYQVTPGEVAPPTQASTPPAPTKGGAGGGGGFGGQDAALREGLAGVAEQRAAIQSQAAIEAEKQRAQQQVAFEKSVELQRQALEEKAANDKAAALADEAMGRAKAIHAKLAAVDTSVDPGRWWASRSTGGKVMAIIGLALGAIGAGNDGVNRAAGLMNQAIDRDLDAQKAEHELRLRKGGQELESANQLYAMQHSALQDGIAARHAAKASALELAASKSEEVAASYASPMAQAQAQLLSGQLRGQAAGEYAKAHARKMEEAKLALLAARSSATGGTAPGDRVAAIRRNLGEAIDIIKRSGTFELRGEDQPRLKKLLNDYATDISKVKDPRSIAREGEVQQELKALGVEAGQLTVSNATAIRLLQKAIADAEARGQAPMTGPAPVED